jgi:ADP-heptose:LPS heptosyltransferase
MVPLQTLTESLAGFLDHHPDYHVQVCGERAEALFMQDLSDVLSSRYSSETVFPEGIIEAAERIRQADLVLALESAPAHLATCMNKKGVFLVGGGHFDFFAPWHRSDRQIWLWERTPCYQCNWNCLYPEPLCMNGIEPTRISGALKHLAG